MFKKLHWKLTIFCTMITGMILLVLSGVCLSISYNGLQKNHYASFLNDLHSIFTHLENQTTISHQWIAQTEKNRQYIVSIYDNGVPLFFEELKHNNTIRALNEQAISIAKENYALDIASASAATIGTQHIEFLMTDHQNKKYYVCAAVLSKFSGSLGAVVICPLENQKKQLRRQILLFCAADALAILLLALFSWFFTLKMLAPIEKSKKRQTQFIASASHELRTPLTVILSCASALKKAEPEETGQFAESIRSESIRMSHLVNDMLLLANADNHSWTMNFKTVQLDTLLIEMYEKYSALAREKQLRLTISLPTTSVSCCKGDRERLEQVLSILINNAFCYTPDKGHIELTLKQHGKTLAIHVTDDGPGIPDSKKDQIFERFYRADSSRCEREHFGLGLCIAREIIMLHKGKIYVRDAKSGGSDFVIVLDALSHK